MEFERLEALSKRYFGDLSDLARAMGKHEKTFYPYKKGNFGRKILKDLEAFGIGEKFLSGESENPFADNEAGRALAQKFGTAPTATPTNGTSAKARAPEWANAAQTSMAQRIARVIELFGGFYQAETILGIPRVELEDSLVDVTNQFPIARECSKFGFSIDWLAFAIGQYYDLSEAGQRLKQAVDSDTVSEWAAALYQQATMRKSIDDIPRQIGRRLSLVRKWVCEFHALPQSEVAFAEFLTKSPFNSGNHIFTAEIIKKWETGELAPNSALNLLSNEGISIHWLMVGTQDHGIFEKNESGIRLHEWYKQRDPEAVRLEAA